MVADGGDTQVWMGMTRTVRRAAAISTRASTAAWGAGSPSPTPRSSATRNRVGCITGDGSVGFNFMEFDTALRKGLPIVAVIATTRAGG